MNLLETLRKNLTPEQFTAVQDAVGDDFDWDMVPRSRLNKVIRQRNELREQLAGKSQSQGAGSAGDNEDDDDSKGGTPAGGQPPVDIKELEKKWKDQQDQAVRDVKIQYAALEKLRAAKAIDAELIWNGGLISKDKLALDANGALTGMDEIITSLKESKAHLFASEGSNDGVPAGTGKNGGDPFKGVTTKEEFLKLDANQQFAFKEANPALFKQFLQG